MSKETGFEPVSFFPRIPMKFRVGASQRSHDNVLSSTFILDWKWQKVAGSLFDRASIHLRNENRFRMHQRMMTIEKQKESQTGREKEKDAGICELANKFGLLDGL